MLLSRKKCQELETLLCFSIESILLEVGSNNGEVISQLKVKDKHSESLTSDVQKRLQSLRRLWKSECHGYGKATCNELGMQLSTINLPLGNLRREVNRKMKKNHFWMHINSL